MGRRFPSAALRSSNFHSHACGAGLDCVAEDANLRSRSTLRTQSGTERVLVLRTLPACFDFWHCSNGCMEPVDHEVGSETRKRLGSRGHKV